MPKEKTLAELGAMPNDVVAWVSSSGMQSLFTVEEGHCLSNDIGRYLYADRWSTSPTWRMHRRAALPQNLEDFL